MTYMIWIETVVVVLGIQLYTSLIVLRLCVCPQPESRLTSNSVDVILCLEVFVLPEMWFTILWLVELSIIAVSIFTDWEQNKITSLS